MSEMQLDEVDAKGSILFLGSGFSTMGKSISGEYLPTGGELKEKFANILNIDGKLHDLKTISEELDSHEDHNLYQILYETFTVKKLDQDQTDILGMPWLRIYTTNFDDSVEFANTSSKRPVNSYCYDDPKPKRLPDNSIIHLHGSVGKMTEDNVLRQLVLNETAYVRQHFESSPWYNDFDRDLRFCSACYFLGYSLSDYHITALLLKNPIVKQKTYFITKPDPDQIFRNRLEPYGTILPIEVSGFAKLCRSLPAPPPKTDPHTLRAFQYIDPFRDRKTLAAPTPPEILNLITYGHFNYHRCLSTLPSPDYVLPRQSHIEAAIQELESANCLLVHSRIGNGKSIFLYLLAHELAQRDYKCFLCRQDVVDVQQDIDLLRKIDRPVFLFDSYNSAIDIIEQLTGLSSQARFVVAVRTGVQEVRLHEIQKRLPSPLQRTNLNRINDKDKKQFVSLLDKSGLRVQQLEEKITKCTDIRDIILTLYDNKEVREKLESEFVPMLQNNEIRRVLAASHLLKSAGHDVDAAFLRNVTGVDAFAALAEHSEFARDFLNLNDEAISVRSPVFSQYVVQNYLDISDIVECAYSIVVQAVRRKEQRTYQAILSSIMRFKVLSDALRKFDNFSSALGDLFDRLRRDIDVNREPLFWLQYSIFMTDCGDLATAEDFIRTAYARAESSPGFQTFQIDTYALRLLLTIEQGSTSDTGVSRFTEIVDKLDRVRQMLADESRRFHAIQVLEGIEPFVRGRLRSFTRQELTGLTYHINLLVDQLEVLAPDARAITGSDGIKASLERAKASILAIPLP